jgi:hypothetical protein
MYDVVKVLKSKEALNRKTHRFPLFLHQ